MNKAEDNLYKNIRTGLLFISILLFGLWISSLATFGFGSQSWVYVILFFIFAVAYRYFDDKIKENDKK